MNYPHIPDPPRVVPLVGTWIEIDWDCDRIYQDVSCPSWARGLKYHIIPLLMVAFVVPLVGTWIEIYNLVGTE